ncbi:MAG: hypothetical protein ACT4OT_11850 [Acidobacteriota bacterium]
MEERGQLRLTLQPDSDGTGQLIAHVSSSGFSGQASAWFNLDDLDNFADQLATIPLSADNPVCLEGGYWSAKKRGTLEQVHLSIRIYPIGAKGQVGAHIHVADCLERNDRRESQNRATVELKTSYAALESFAKDIRRLRLSQTNEAILREETLL